ncbi:Ig-like domain-containing protein [Bifidobacterium jacchi]|uniref:Beta-hexosaminidase n=1 Tax=Bifidobacterium jacchi TaxID=2490545 RepID=A0A5N5RL81_9BIFI|nr:Ig-like domain-containing protein [Bifidobacterium jacchi]KAB5608047.1 beta-hexosaminidase [Bifidobacterium jacchi]
MRTRSLRQALGGIIAAATLLGVGITGVGTASAADNANIALNKEATASSYEVESTSPAKAVDGKQDSHWGTAQNKADNEWLNVKLGDTAQTVRQINVDFERKDSQQNILSYKVELKNGSGDYEKVYEKANDGTRAKQHEVVTLDADKQATDVKVTILKADAGIGGLSWLNVGISELEVYSAPKKDVVSTNDVNHLKNATMTASGVEENTQFTADKATDGDTSTRWASNYETPTNKIWIKGAFTNPTVIKEIKITFHTRDVAQMPSNVKSFDLKYTKEDGTEETLKDNYEVETSGSGYATDITIRLDQAVTATALTLTDFATDTTQSTSYNNISIAEWKAYSNDQVASLDSVVTQIENDQRTIDTKTDTLTLPTVPAGYTVAFNGADFEQLISKDLKVNHPLNDKTVKVSYVVTKTADNTTKTTADIAYTVKGTTTEQADKNAKPNIIPEIAEWHSESNAKLDAATVTTVTYDDDSLKAIVDEFVADYKDFTGRTLTAKKAAESQANAFNFSKPANADAALKQLGDESYTMEIKADRINAASTAVTGDMYAMQTILQMTKQDNTGFVIGTMRDYPRFAVRGFVLDMARKPISMEMVRQIARTMRYYKMNDFQTHLSDNYIFLENYGKKENEDEGFKAYDAFRLETSLKNDKGESPTATDYAISKKDFKEFIQSERALGMNIVPEIDVPAHATSFTKVWPELGVKNMVSPLNGNRSLIDHINVADPEAVKLIERIFDDYTKGDDPTFDSKTTVHIGADEFLANYTSYRQFINTFVPYIKATNTVRMWGGLTWINDGKTEINKDAIDNVEMNLWSRDWADGMQMYNMGYKLINTIDTYGYMVPNGGGSRGSYGDYLDVNGVFNSFEPNRVSTKSGWQYIPSGDDQALGAAFAIWNDNIDKKASGVTESDEYARFFDALPFYAEKNWASTGKEKGTAAALTTLAKKQGDAPRTNPYYQSTADDNDLYEKYTFDGTGEAAKADSSANKRDLTTGGEGNTAAIKDGVLSLNGGTSYVTTPIDQLGNGNQVSFDITLNEPAKPGDIIFETDAPYATQDIRIMDDGTLGFTRELYDYSFDYALPIGRKVNVTIVAQQQKTSLYIDGKFVSNAKGKFVDKGLVKKTGITNSTLALPIKRIGSKTNAIKATIDNVVVNTADEASDPFEKICWTGTTNSETPVQSNGTEGLLKYAFDNNKRTIWHSNWVGATDKLENGKTYFAELTFCNPLTINRFAFTPRQDSNSGRVTKADLFIKGPNDTEWKQVATDQTFANDQTEKLFEFPEQEVKAVKFVAKASSDGWVAVSEFDVYDIKAQVWAQADPADGGTVSATLEGGEAGEAGATASVDVAAGVKVTLKATPKSGYRFTGWYNTLSETAVSTDATYELTPTGNTALIARFEKTTTPEPTPVTKVTVSGDKEVVVGNTTTTLAAKVDPDGATYKSLVWSSDKPAVASVDAKTGVVKGVAAGTATITATVTNEDGSTVTGTFEITVKANDGGEGGEGGETKPDKVPATSVKVTAENGKNEVAVDGTLQLKATVAPENATYKSLVWSSDKPAVASVDEKTGVVKGVAAGTATITATVTNEDGSTVTGTFTVTVTKKDGGEGGEGGETKPDKVPVTSVAVTTADGKTTVTVGKKIALTATVTPTNATDKTVTWKSGDLSIATVNADGLVTGVKAGKVTITATANDGSGKSGSIVVEVVPAKGGDTGTDIGTDVDKKPGKKPGVADTGASVAAVALVGALLIGCGAAITLRRRSDSAR